MRIKFGLDFKTRKKKTIATAKYGLTSLDVLQVVQEVVHFRAKYTKRLWRQFLSRYLEQYFLTKNHVLVMVIFIAFTSRFLSGVKRVLWPKKKVKKGKIFFVFPLSPLK